MFKKALLLPIMVLSLGAISVAFVGCGGGSSTTDAGKDVAADKASSGGATGTGGATSTGGRGGSDGAGTGGRGGGAGGAAGAATGGRGGTAGGAGGGAGAGGAAIPSVVVFVVTLNDAMEVPAVTATAGTGSATVTLHTATGAVIVTNGSFAGLSGAATMVDIHGLAAATEGGAAVIVPLTVNAGGTVGSGKFGGSGTVIPANVTGMLAGMTYLDVHTAMNTGGEIRGQIH